jgi:hypothetical protein
MGNHHQIICGEPNLLFLIMLDLTLRHERLATPARDEPG